MDKVDKLKQDKIDIRFRRKAYWIISFIFLFLIDAAIIVWADQNITERIKAFIVGFGLMNIVSIIGILLIFKIGIVNVHKVA
jgi:hypothetical protein